MDNICVEDKRIKTLHIIKNGIVCSKPCWLLSLAATTYADFLSLSYIYNGFGTNGEKILPFEPTSIFNHYYVFPYPIFFSKGIYVVLGTPNSPTFFQFILDTDV